MKIHRTTGLRPRPSKSPATCRGSSLIELLVSILLVSVGVMSFEASLVNSARFNKSTEHRVAATLLANDLADRMRANRSAAIAAAYDLKAVYGEAVIDAPAAASCRDTACTPEQLAAADIADWLMRLRQALPRGGGYAKLDAEDKAVDLWVAWSDPRANADDARGSRECPAAFVAGVAVQPRCSYFRVNL